MDISEKPIEQYNRDILDLFAKNGLHAGRMVGGSKSGYIDKHPDHFVIFNANVVSKLGKVWWGDLDLTKDGKKLKAIAQEMSDVLYVLRELDGRFDKEGDPVEKLIQRAIWSTDKGRYEY